MNTYRERGVAGVVAVVAAVVVCVSAAPALAGPVRFDSVTTESLYARVELPGGQLTADEDFLETADPTSRTARVDTAPAGAPAAPRASGVMDMIFGDDRIGFNGSLDLVVGSPAVGGNVTAIIETPFFLDEAVVYTFAPARPGPLTGEGFGSAFTLSRDDLEPAPADIQLDQTVGLPDSQRVLLPGRYTALFTANVNVVAGQGADVHFDYGGTVTFQPVASAIPLPAAGWAALVSTGVFGLAHRAARRRRR